MIKPAEFKKLLKGHEDCLPMLTLSEFFDGNTIEDSIAPNQYGYGRPSLAEIWGTLRKIEALPSVAWIRVVLHYDTAIKESGGEEVLYLSGDTIALCTTARPSEIEALANCEWLCSDGGNRSFPIVLGRLFLCSACPQGISLPGNCVGLTAEA